MIRGLRQGEREGSPWCTTGPKGGDTIAGAGWASLFVQRCIAVVAWATKEVKNGWMTDPSSGISTETRTRILVLQHPNSNPKHHLLLNLTATISD